MINIETLKQISDAELNELAAVKVMGLQQFDALVKIKNGWNPTGDMNDAIVLFEVMVQDVKYSDATITYPWFVVAGWNPMSDESGWEIQVDDDKLPRAITIAAILAKGEDKSD